MLIVVSCTSCHTPQRMYYKLFATLSLQTSLYATCIIWSHIQPSLFIFVLIELCKEMLTTQCWLSWLLFALQVFLHMGNGDHALHWQQAQCQRHCGWMDNWGSLCYDLCCQGNRTKQIYCCVCFLMNGPSLCPCSIQWVNFRLPSINCLISKMNAIRFRRTVLYLNLYKAVWKCLLQYWLKHSTVQHCNSSPNSRCYFSKLFPFSQS